MPGGRLSTQRDIAYQMLTDIPGVSCVKPKAAMYLFPKLDPKLYPIADDEQLVLDLLKQQRVLVVQGSAFNLEDTQHLRIVFLPDQALLEESISRLANFLAMIRGD